MSEGASRLLWFLATFLSTLLLPWWVSIFIIIFLLVNFETYYEVIFFGFIFDIIYLPDLHFPYTGLTIATFALLLSIYIKSIIRT